MDVLECDHCSQPYDTSLRLPKLLPCRHTFCLTCLLQSSEGYSMCPVDEKIYMSNPWNLPSNLHVMGKLQECSQEMLNKSLVYSESGAREECVELTEASARQLHAKALDILKSRLWEVMRLFFSLRKDVLGELDALLSEYKDRHRKAADLAVRLRQSGVADHREEVARVVQTISWMKQDTFGNHLKLSDRMSFSVHREGVGMVCQAADLLLEHQPLLRTALVLFREQLHRKPGGSPKPAPSPSQPAVSQAAAPQPGEKKGIKVDVNLLSLSTDEKSIERRKTMLASNVQVHVLSNVFCTGPGTDPEWSLAMLWKHGPHLEDISLIRPCHSHLTAVQSMPRLRRLQVWSVSNKVEEKPFLFHADSPANKEQQPPDGAGGANRANRGGLEWLQLRGVPRATVQSLLAANGNSLRKLRLAVGTGVVARNYRAARWPESCNDLEAVFEACGELPSLESVTLVRIKGKHYKHLCEQQLAAVQCVLHHTRRVRCSWCRD